MFYAVIWDMNAVSGERKAAAAIRYNKKTDSVSFVAKSSMIPVLKKIFDSNNRTGIWATSRTSDSPLKRIARSISGGEFFPEGSGQEDFMKASMDLEGERSMTVEWGDGDG